MFSYLQSSWVAFFFSVLFFLPLKVWISPNFSLCHLLTGLLPWFKAHLAARVGQPPPPGITQISPETSAGQWAASLGVSLCSCLSGAKRHSMKKRELRRRERRGNEQHLLLFIPPEEVHLYLNMIFNTFVCPCVETMENFYVMQYL